jgi:hypothetical protein
MKNACLVDKCSKTEVVNWTSFQVEAGSVTRTKAGRKRECTQSYQAALLSRVLGVKKNKN